MKLLAKMPMPLTDADALEDDRRWNKRNKLLKNVRIYRQNNPSCPEKTGTVIDVSREGLYFTVQSNDYQIGMELRLIVPEAKTECMCEVVRIETLPGGRTGIGVRVSSWRLDSLQRLAVHL
jgi:PilZ domain